MTSRDKDLDLAEYVLGSLEPAERERVASAVSADPELRQRVEDWEQRLAALDRCEELVEPSANLWSEIESALAHPSFDSPTLTVRSDEGQWIELMPGVTKKTLMLDEELGEESYLLRMAPGVTLPQHSHRLNEECLLLEGDCKIGDLELHPGDFHVAFANTDHQDVTTVAGALVFIKGELRAA